MSEHWVEFNRYIWKGFIYSELKLNPEDFLECKDEGELTDAIYDIISMEIDTGDVRIDESESEQRMEIPKRFKIANTEYEVQVVDKSDDGNYGYHNDIRRKIVVAKSMDDEGKIVQLTEQQIENTFWHELFHCFQFFYNNKQDEALAQSFANFMCEYRATRAYEL